MVCVTKTSAGDLTMTSNQQTSKSLRGTEVLENYNLVKLTSVHFSYGKSDLSVAEIAVLKTIAKEFSKDAHAVIELRGYTDGKEFLACQQTLSTGRAQT